MEQAIELYSRSTWRFVMKWSVIDSLKRMTRAGLVGAREVIAKENDDWANTMLIKRGEGLSLLGELSEEEILALSQKQTETCLERAQGAVSASSLIFAHSILDATAHDYCRVSALAQPSDWRQFVRDKKVSLLDAGDKSFAELLWQEIEKELSKLERESLLKKVETLLQVCHPSAGWQPLPTYSFDRSRIKSLDKLRHEIVHGGLLSKAAEVTESDLFYLQFTGLFLGELIEFRYGITVNPVYGLQEAGI